MKSEQPEPTSAGGASVNRAITIKGLTHVPVRKKFRCQSKLTDRGICEIFQPETTSFFICEIFQPERNPALLDPRKQRNNAMRCV